MGFSDRPSGEREYSTLGGTSVRLLAVGGAGSLYVDPEHKTCVADLPDFPDIFKPVAAAHDKALKELRTRNDVKWTYLFRRQATSSQTERERANTFSAARNIS